MTSIFLSTSMTHMQMAKVLPGWTPRKESHCRLNETIPQGRKPIDLKQPRSSIPWYRGKKYMIRFWIVALGMLLHLLGRSWDHTKRAMRRRVTSDTF
jgi:hypothetical protein